MKKALKTQLTQERILEAALIEFAQKGYRSFRINELCKKHGISKGVLYHNFSGKEELYLSCVRESFQKAVAVIGGKADDVPSLSDYMERRHRFYREFPHHSHVFFEAWLTAPPEIAEAIEAEKAVFEDLNTEVSQKLLAVSKLKAAISPSQAMDYLAFIQQLFRSYYLLAETGNDLSYFVKKYETDLNKVLELMIYGILEDDKE